MTDDSSGLNFKGQEPHRSHEGCHQPSLQRLDAIYELLGAVDQDAAMAKLRHLLQSDRNSSQDSETVSRPLDTTQGVVHVPGEKEDFESDDMFNDMICEIARIRSECAATANSYLERALKAENALASERLTASRLSKMLNWLERQASSSGSGVRISTSSDGIEGGRTGWLLTHHGHASRPKTTLIDAIEDAMRTFDDGEPAIAEQPPENASGEDQSTASIIDVCGKQEDSPSTICFLDGIDWQHHLPNDKTGTLLFPSEESLRAERHCIAKGGCGIVEVEVKFLRWSQPQKLTA